jgi:hypothetical protein
MTLAIVGVILTLWALNLSNTAERPAQMVEALAFAAIGAFCIYVGLS